MYREFAVPVSYAGGISAIISIGTVISSLQSDRLTKRLGTGRVTALSVLTTAVALFGFSVSHSFAALCLWAIPYGLGAGSVDASLNNYVALHYASRHMSWLHCMWGLGASLGPYIMGYALTGGGWSTGYRIIALLQFALAAALLLTLPLWKTRAADAAGRGASAAAPAEKGHPHSGRKGGHGGILLLLRRRTDRHSVGEQLSGPSLGAVRAGGGEPCQPVLRGHHRRAGAVGLSDAEIQRCADDPVWGRPSCWRACCAFCFPLARPRR